MLDRSEPALRTPSRDGFSQPCRVSTVAEQSSPAARAVSAWPRVRCRWSVFDKQAEVVDEAGVAQQIGIGLESPRLIGKGQVSMNLAFSR